MRSGRLRQRDDQQDEPERGQADADPLPAPDLESEDALREDADEATVRGISRTYRPAPFLYLAITLVALVSPPTGAALFGAFALFWLFESSLFGRDRASA